MTILAPSAENASEATGAASAFTVAASLPSATVQTFTVLSAEPVRSFAVLAQGEVTASPWPAKSSRTPLPSFTFQSFADLSAEPESSEVARSGRRPGRSRLLVALEGLDFLAVGDAEDAHFLVVAGDGDLRAVGAEGQGGRGGRKPLDLLHVVTFFGVHDADGLVVEAEGERAPSP
ncbi:MAG: hypothetical protein U0835_11940 [Isosphaeraceae bacterium]